MKITDYCNLWSSELIATRWEQNELQNKCFSYTAYVGGLVFNESPSRRLADQGAWQI
jgi:hypothetical protein